MVRKNRFRYVALFFGTIVLWFSPLSRSARACELCGPPSVTLAEQLSTAQHVLLVKWISARLAADGKPGSATFEIVRDLQPGSGRKPGEVIQVPRYLPGEKGKQYLLFGKAGATAEKVEPAPEADWGVPTEVTEGTCRYVLEAPAFDAPSIDRLAYYAKFLEHAHLTIANDAHAEFVNARAEAIAGAAKNYPREKLRKWLTDKKTPINRLAAYGLMLGHCGQAEDVPFLERLISNSADAPRSTSAGIIAGYLFLARDKGLTAVERIKLAPGQKSLDEAYPALQALRYLWSYGMKSVPREGVQRVMRGLVTRPEFFDLVIVDLARWKDWSVMPQLVALYGTKNFDDRTSKKAIISYLLAAQKDVPAGAKEPKPQHVIDADRHLTQMRERDGQLVSDVEKFFYLR